MNRADALGGGAIFLFGLATALLAIRMPLGSFRAAGPGLFPFCLGLLLMVLAGSFTVGALRRRRRHEDPTAGASRDREGSLRNVAGFGGGIGLAAAALPYLGYAPTAALLVFFLLQLLGGEKRGLNLAIAFGTGAAAHLLFVKWLQIPFVPGWFGL